jgi:hypothetical protein
MLHDAMRLRGMMRRVGGAALLVGVGLAVTGPARAQMWQYTGGEQTYLVPLGAAAVQVTAVGAPGGKGDAGAAPASRSCPC